MEYRGSAHLTTCLEDIELALHHVNLTDMTTTSSWKNNLSSSSEVDNYAGFTDKITHVRTSIKKLILSFCTLQKDTRKDSEDILEVFIESQSALKELPHNTPKDIEKILREMYINLLSHQPTWERIAKDIVEEEEEDIVADLKNRIKKLKEDRNGLREDWFQTVIWTGEETFYQYCERIGWTDDDEF